MSRRTPKDDEHTHIHIEYEILDAEPEASTATVTSSEIPDSSGRFGFTLFRHASRRRVYYSVLACLFLALIMFATHLGDTYAQQRSSRNSIAAHVEIIDLSTGVRSLQDSADQVIPFAVFNDGASTFTLLSIQVLQPGLTTSPVTSDPVDIPPGTVRQVPIHFSESCSNPSVTSEAGHATLTVRNAFGNQWSVSARLVDPLHALLAPRALCSSSINLTAALPSQSAGVQTPQIQGKTFTIRMAVTSQSPQPAYVAAVTETTLQQGFEASAQLTRIQPYQTREVSISVTVNDCHVALNSSELIDAPPLAVVDGTGKRVSGSVTFAPSTGQSLRLTIAYSLIHVCGTT